MGEEGSGKFNKIAAALIRNKSLLGNADTNSLERFQQLETRVLETKRITIRTVLTSVSSSIFISSRHDVT